MEKIGLDKDAGSGDWRIVAGKISRLDLDCFLPREDQNVRHKTLHTFRKRLNGFFGTKKSKKGG